MSQRPVCTRMRLGGATLLTLEDHSLPTVRFVVALRHGSLTDPQGAAGALRLTLELMLRGTERCSREEFADELESLGSTLGTAPGTETAFLRGACLARYLPKTIALLGEALTQPAFADDELVGLRSESIELLRAERDDDETVAERFMRKAVYRGHPLERSPSGEVPELEGIDRALLAQVHAQRFCADELVFAFAGDVEPEAVQAMLEPVVRKLPKTRGPRVELPGPATVEGVSLLVVDKPERVQTQLRLATLLVDGRHPDVLPLWLGIVAFGGTFTSPFTREVREVRGWSYTAHADFQRRNLLRAPLVLRSVPSAADAVDCLALELDLYAGLARGEVPREALELARSYVLNRYPFEIATAADMLGSVVKSELLGLPADEIYELPSRIEALSFSEIPRVLERHVRADSLRIVLVGSAADLVPRLRARFESMHIDVVDFRAGLTR